MQEILSARATKALFTAVLGATLFAGCMDSSDQSENLDDSTANNSADAELNSHHDQTLPPIGADQEYGFVNGDTYTFRFPGFFTPQAETFFIWNLGTSIQHNAPYPSNSHGKLYAVFAPGPAGSTHHVAGQDGFDHYHLMNQGEGTRTFDVYLVFQGANYNAATFHAPLSERDMNRAVSAGILATPLLTNEAGFDQLVFKVPVVRFHDDHGHGW
jgi:hypothetical protein